jgi:uncharacterized protein YecE (DUF72 family)
VFADTAGRWPYFEDLTAGFVYLRLHGDAVRVSAAPSPRRRSRAVYGCLDNDVKVHAPFDALRLRALLGLPHRRWRGGKEESSS